MTCTDENCFADMQKEIDRLQAELAGASAYIETLKANNAQLVMQTAETIADYDQMLKERDNRIKALEAALQPFAKIRLENRPLVSVIEPIWSDHVKAAREALEEKS